MDIKKADNKGRVSGFTPGDHYFVTGPLDGKWSIKEVPTVDVVPEGYELAEISDAKNAVLDLLHANQNIDPEEVDLIGLSDSIVEELLKMGGREVDMRITENTKYVVRDWTTHQAITQGANRSDAHAVRRHLGDRFYVFNRVTRKESR